MIIKTKATVEDYRKLPEGAKYELIDGEIIERENPNMPSPRILHQELSADLMRILGNLVHEKQRGNLLHAPTDVYLDAENVVQPDILFIETSRVAQLRKEDGIYGAPDLIIEILSPSTGYYDLKKKFHLYERHGIKEYFVIDPVCD